MNRLDEDILKILNESPLYSEYEPDADDLMANLSFDIPDYKGSFAEWFGEDLTGQVYEGSISCAEQDLKNLFGAPKIVKGRFDCSFNQLTSLEGAPEQVEGAFICENNNLTSLKGAPQVVGKDFFCENNKLTSLEGAPHEVKGYFYCDDYLKDEAREMGYKVSAH